MRKNRLLLPLEYRRMYRPVLGCVSGDFRDGRNKSGVYAIINVGKDDPEPEMYIGSAKNLSGRWSAHRSDLKKNKHHSPRLQNAWNKYGPKAFWFVILIFCDASELRETEQRYIDSISPILNATRYANRPPETWKCNKPNHFKGKKHTEESLRMMGLPRELSAGKNNPMFGVRLVGPLNPMWGRKRPDIAEFNRRTKKGKTLEELYGPERGAALRAGRAHTGKANGMFEKGRPVVQLTLDNEVVAVFPNALRAAAALGKSYAGIYQCINGGGTRGAKTAHGYKWKFADEHNT